jgi:hypothetical protein
MKNSARVGLPLIRSYRLYIRHRNNTTSTPVHNNIRDLFQTRQRHASSTAEPSTPESSNPELQAPESSTSEPSVLKHQRLLIKKSTRVKNDNSMSAMKAYAFENAKVVTKDNSRLRATKTHALKTGSEYLAMPESSIPESSVPNPRLVFIKRPGVVIKDNPRFRAIKKYALKVASRGPPRIRFYKGEASKPNIFGDSWSKGQQQMLPEDGVVIKRVHPQQRLEVKSISETVRKVQFTFRKTYDLGADHYHKQKATSSPIRNEDLAKDILSDQAVEKDGSSKIVAPMETRGKSFQKVEGLNKWTLAGSEAASKEDIPQNYQALAEEDSKSEAKPKQTRPLTFRKIVAGADMGALHIQAETPFRVRRMVSKSSIPLSQIAKENDSSKKVQAKEDDITGSTTTSDTRGSRSSLSSQGVDLMKLSTPLESSRQQDIDKFSKFKSSKFTPQESTIPYRRKVKGVLVRKLEKEFVDVPIRQYRSEGLKIRTHIAAKGENADTESPRELARKMDFERKGILSKETSKIDD